MMLSLWRYPSAGLERTQAHLDSAGGASYTGLIWLGLFASFLFFANIFGFWTYIERIGQAAGLDTETIGWALACPSSRRFSALVSLRWRAIAMVGHCRWWWPWQDCW